MATIQQRQSDLSGVNLEKDSPYVKVSLTVDGDIAQYEIDLTTDELDELRKVLSPYFTAGRFTPGKETVKANSTGDVERNRTIRDWATANPGFIHKGEAIGTPNERGRLGAKFVEAYEFYLKNADQVDAETAAKAEAEAAANGNGPQDVVAPEFKPAAAKGRK